MRDRKYILPEKELTVILAFCLVQRRKCLKRCFNIQKNMCDLSEELQTLLV